MKRTRRQSLTVDRICGRTYLQEGWVRGSRSTALRVAPHIGRRTVRRRDSLAGTGDTSSRAPTARPVKVRTVRRDYPPTKGWSTALDILALDILWAGSCPPDIPIPRIFDGAPKPRHRSLVGRSWTSVDTQNRP